MVYPNFQVDQLQFDRGATPARAAESLRQLLRSFAPNSTRHMRIAKRCSVFGTVVTQAACLPPISLSFMIPYLCTILVPWACNIDPFYVSHALHCYGVHQIRGHHVEQDSFSKTFSG